MKRKSVGLALAAILAASMGMSAMAADSYLVGFANNSDTYNYCAKFRTYLKEATEAEGIDIMVTDAGGDTNVQNGQIDDFIVQNANAVSAISNDLDGSVPALKAAEDAGIPYISFLTTVSGGDDYDGYIYVGSPNVDAGTAQGEYLVDVLPENAKILYFTGEPNDQQYLDLSLIHISMEEYDYAAYTAADVERALSHESCSIEDFKALLSPAAAPYLEQMARKAEKITQNHFGNTVYIFTPLYIANYCQNYCIYCGFNCYNNIRRKKLTFEEIEHEMQVIARTGMEEILILTGESRAYSDVKYIGEAVKIAKKYFKNIGIEIYPVNVDEYQ